MKLKNTLFFLIVFLMSIHVSAQDRHFSLYNFSPMTLNPAHAGAFLGSIRVGGIFRDQNFGFQRIGTAGSNNIYLTPSVYVDSPVLSVRKRDWVGAGLYFLSDQSGTLDFGTTKFMISGAYHLSMDKKSNNVLTLGLQFGSISRTISDTEAIFTDPGMGEQLLGTGQGGGSGVDNNNPSTNDFGIGLMLRSKANRTTNVEVGLAAFHLTSPAGASLVGAGTGNPNPPVIGTGNPFRFIERTDIPLLITAHGKFEMKLSKKWSFAPSFLIQKTNGSGFETVLQVPVGMILNEEKEQKIHFGLGYRVGDALEVLLGFDQGRLRVGASYDLHLTSDIMSYSSGAFELAAAYIINIYKEPEVKPVIICPRF